jgi:hypothetical protein
MIQTKSFFTASLAAGATGTIGTIDKAGAKISILAIGHGNNNFISQRIVLRDSARRYEFVVGGLGSGLTFVHAYDADKGRYKSPIELEGNVVFEIVNDTAGACTNNAASVLYDISFPNQKP